MRARHARIGDMATSEHTAPAPRSGRPLGRIVAWEPGSDTVIAALTVVAFWLCYWGGSAVHWSILPAGIIVVGTLIPVWVVLRQRREGLAGLGIRGRFVVISLVISAVLGAGSVYQAMRMAEQHGVDVWQQLAGNVVVLWEPLFVFGWVFLRFDRAFGWLPAILLTAAGFVLQHVGSVPLAAALGFGVFALVAGAVFATVRNLLVLWPLFYPVASTIGTIQAGVIMDWSQVGFGAGVLLVQVLILAALAQGQTPRADAARCGPD